MPELPEVETSRLGIIPHIQGQNVEKVVLRHTQLRWPINQELGVKLEHQTISTISRRGKYIIIKAGHGNLILHLGMSGSLRIVPVEMPYKKHDHVAINFSNGLSLRLNDPRRFGAIIWTETDPLQHALLKALGVEPLTEAFNDNYLFEASRQRKTSVKQFLMDSHIVVGVGNIYANEVLFAAKINPHRAAGKLTLADCKILVTNIKKILSLAIKQGGTTLRDFLSSEGKPGYFSQQLQAYGRSGLPCPHCKHILKTTRLGQRATVYCPVCQKK